jgi:hypothetical protein
MDRNTTEGVADVRKIVSGRNFWGIPSDISIYHTMLSCTASYKLIVKQCLHLISYNNTDQNLTFCWTCILYFRPAHDTVTDTQWQIPEVVLIQFVSPDDEHNVLETCTELNKYIVKNCASRWSFTKKHKPTLTLNQQTPPCWWHSIHYTRSPLRKSKLHIHLRENHKYH